VIPLQGGYMAYAWVGPKREKVCVGCGKSFVPRIGKQRWCYPCHTPCPDCGGAKDVRAVRCRKCDAASQEGISKPGCGRKAPTIEKVIHSIETIGLQPDRQFAFGYVIGVTFGDGCITVAKPKTAHKCKSGRVTRCVQTDHRFRLQVTNRDFAEAFAQQWGILTSVRPSVAPMVRTNFQKSTIPGHVSRTVHLYSVSPRNRPLARYLHRLKYSVGSTALPTFPRQVQLGILCGIIDSEGYIAKKHVDVANKDVALLEAVQTIFRTFGYPARIYRSPSQTVAHLRFYF
jgi:hypothetical protein